MRILVVSALYPPIALGGYEVECAGVVERLSERHNVLVLTGDLERRQAETSPLVRRELKFLSHDERGALIAPLASVRAVASARSALAWDPDLIYVWNGSMIPQSALRVFSDSGVPIAVRVCEHWFGRLFVEDQFLRELLPARRSVARSAWASACKGLNRLPTMRLTPEASMQVAVSWNSETMRRLAKPPEFVQPIFERVTHSVPRYGEVYSRVVRKPAPTPEILFVGRVTPLKGLRIAIEALALLRSEHNTRARLVVVGPEDRAHGAEMRSLAQRLEVGDLVLWRGQRTPEEVAQALATAHVMIVPSDWEEPFPLVTIEGAFAGVPLVAADVGGISEGMHDEEHALLFPRGDSEAAAAAIARTLSEHASTRARVERARERAESFRAGPYLDEQERFVIEAHEAFDACG
jgi:glycosyltransferase involved in cell wall biosynthesis